MSYFSNLYSKLRYPRSDLGTRGLHNAQLGAIHAIASHGTLNTKDANIIVMPTGSGKTAVFMMAPYVLAKKKVLIVTPSIMVRSQIFDDFRVLQTLRYIGVFGEEVELPKVYELKSIYSEAQNNFIVNAEVVVGTPQVSLSLSESAISSNFDYIIIDEAHHVPAATWQKILENIKHADVLLVTATPFRLDKKEIKGKTIFTYPLSMAYKDGIFGEITYIPIEEAPEKDKLIAIEAERVLLNDRVQGFDHYLMVRTDTKANAKSLELIYQEHTNLNLKRIDSSSTNNTVRRTIEKLKAKEIDGIICVNMLGEGFDFPNLKIAAVHVPHKSLSSTLQFIGRFARTNAPNIGSAKFIAMNDDELLVENYSLFSSDAIWQEIIIDMSEQKLYKAEANKSALKEFVKADNPSETAVSLYNIRPNCHAKIYSVDIFHIDNEFPSECGIGEEVFRDYSNNTIIAVAKNKSKPTWYAGDLINDVENLLYIVHYQASTSLLFIYSQIKSEVFYNKIAEAFSDSTAKIPRNEMNRVLGGMENYEFFNTGMQNRYAESGESYRIYSGSNTASSIDETTGKMRSAGHAFCKATKDNKSLTIGYSSGSKIWSSSFLNLADYVNWCDEYGMKITDNEMIVKTNTNYDLLKLPSKLKAYPLNVFFGFLSEKTYSSPPVVLLDGKQEFQFILTDASITVSSVSKDFISVTVKIDDVEESLRCDIEGNYFTEESRFVLMDGRQEFFLSDYFSNHPLQFKTTDDTLIIGNEIFEGDPDSVIYSDDHIISIDWLSYKTDVRREFGNRSSEGLPIHNVLEELLKQKESYTYIIYDHGTGEIADFITITEDDTKIDVEFFHVKAQTGRHYNSNINDIYEVFQQAVKSIIWLKTKQVLLQKIIDRRKAGKCNFLRNSLEDLKISLKKDKFFTAKIYVVQPAISKNQTMPEKFKEVIAAATFYIRHSGRVKELNIWGSL